MQNKNFYNKELCRWIEEKAVNYWWTLNQIFSQLPDVFFSNEKYLIQSCHRYFNIFLPLLKYSVRFNFPVVPPPDVELVWMCHIMAPESYKTDCNKFIQFVPDHSLLNLQNRQKALNFTKFIWFSQFPKQPFYLDFNNDQNCQKFGFKLIKENSLKKIDIIRKIVNLQQQQQQQQVQQQENQLNQQFLNNQLENSISDNLLLNQYQDEDDEEEEQIYLLKQQLKQHQQQLINNNIPLNQTQKQLCNNSNNNNYYCLDTYYSDEYDQYLFENIQKQNNQNPDQSSPNNYQIYDHLNSNNQNCDENNSQNIDNSHNYQNNWDILKNFSLDIISAIQSMRIFYFQINLPHFKDVTFIKRGILMYVCAIDANVEFEHFSTGFNFYLLWHTHLLHPKKYKKDTKNIQNGNYSHFQKEFGIQNKQQFNQKQLTPKQRKKIVNDFWRSRLVQCGLEGAQFWGVPNFFFAKKSQFSNKNNNNNNNNNLFGVKINLIKQGKFKQQNHLHKLPFSKKQYILQNQQEFKHNLKQIKQFTTFSNHVFQVNFKSQNQIQNQKFFAKVVLNPLIQLHAVDVYNNAQQKKDQKLIQINQIGNEVLPSRDDLSSNLQKQGYPFYQNGHFYVQMCIYGKKIAIFEAFVESFGDINIKAYWLTTNNYINTDQKYDFCYNRNQTNDLTNMKIYKTVHSFQNNPKSHFGSDNFLKRKCISSKEYRKNSDQTSEQLNKANMVLVRDVIAGTATTRDVFGTKIPPVYGTKKETSIKLDVERSELLIDDIILDGDKRSDSVQGGDFVLLQSFGVFMSLGVLLAKCQKNVDELLGANLETNKMTFCGMFGAGHKLLPEFQKRSMQFAD